MFKQDFVFSQASALGPALFVGVGAERFQFCTNSSRSVLRATGKDRGISVLASQPLLTAHGQPQKFVPSVPRDLQRLGLG